MSKSRKYETLFKYFPSSLYGGYDFLYGEKRKINYWFRYYLFPRYGRYVFLYDVIDELLIDNPSKILERVSSFNSLNIYSTQDLEREKYKDMSHIKEDAKLERIEKIINNEQGKDIEKLKRINIFNLIQEKMFYNIENIDKNIGEFADYCIANKIKDTNIFSTMQSDPILDRNNTHKIETLYDFILSKIIREISIENAEHTINRIKQNLIFEDDNFNKIKKISYEIENGMKEDAVLKEILEDLFLYEMGKLKLKSEIRDIGNEVGDNEVLNEAIDRNISFSNNSILVNSTDKMTTNENNEVGLKVDINFKRVSETHESLDIKDKKSKTSQEDNVEETGISEKECKGTLPIDNVTSFNEKIEKRKKFEKNEVLNIKSQTSKNIRVENDLNDFINIGNKYEKSVRDDSNEYFISHKVSKNTVITDHERYISTKVGKDTLITSNETRINYKVGKDTYITNNELGFNAKVGKSTYVTTNEKYFEVKVLKMIKIDNSDFDFIKHKVGKNIKAVDKTQFLNSAKNKRMNKSNEEKLLLGTLYRKIDILEEFVFGNKTVNRDLDHSFANITEISKSPETTSSRDLDFNYSYDMVAKTPSRNVDYKETGGILNAKTPSRKVDQNSENEISRGARTPSRELDIGDLEDLGRAISTVVDEEQFGITNKELYRVPSDSVNDSQEDAYRNQTIGDSKKDIREDLNEDNLDKSIKKETKIEELFSLSIEQRKIKEEAESRLNMHKRFWFVKEYGRIDYKILSNTDFNYPVSINIFDDEIDGIYKFEYDTEFENINGSYVVEIYDRNYKRIATHRISNVGNYDQTIDNINVKINISQTGHKHILGKFEITIYNITKAEYMIIRQPKNYLGNSVLYTTTEKTLAEKHPIPFGNDMGLKEIPVHIPIMVDFINILLLMWSKFYMAFTGYTGTNAVYGLVSVVYDWLTLETSLENESFRDYERCFRWFRWEAEKVYNKAKHDPQDILGGNRWVEELIFEMIDYMEMHHMDVMPQFEPIGKMDEYRQLFDDPSFDIPIIIDKYKGVRKRVLDKHKKLND